MTADPALHVVSGKGGVGKSTITCAIAIALAEAGKRVLVVETEGRGSLPDLLGVAHVGYDEQRISGAWAGELWAQSIESAPALVDYVRMFFPFPGASSILQRSGATTFVTAIAPGLRDVLITGKFCEAARRRRGSQYAFDAVVVDAPPTGRVHTFLNVTNAVSLVSPPGTVRAHAERIRNVIVADTTRVHLVVNEEESAVQEATEAIAALTNLGIHVGAIIHNRAAMRWPALAAPSRLSEMLAAAGLADGSTEVLAALSVARDASDAHFAAASRVLTPLRNSPYPLLEVSETVAATTSDLPLRLARLIDVDQLQAQS